MIWKPAISELRFASYRAALESYRYFLILSGKDVVRAPRSAVSTKEFMARPVGPVELLYLREVQAVGWRLAVLPVMCVLVRRLRHVFEPVFHFRNEAFDHTRQRTGFSLHLSQCSTTSEQMSCVVGARAASAP